MAIVLSCVGVTSLAAATLGDAGTETTHRHGPGLPGPTIELQDAAGSYDYETADSAEVYPGAPEGQVLRLTLDGVRVAEVIVRDACEPQPFMTGCTADDGKIVSVIFTLPSSREVTVTTVDDEAARSLRSAPAMSTTRSSSSRPPATCAPSTSTGSSSSSEGARHRPSAN